MSIKINIPESLAASLAKGQELFTVKGSTVRACIKDLITILPGIKKSLFYGEKGLLRSTIEVMVNNARLDAKDLSKKVNDGDSIQIKMNLR